MSALFEVTKSTGISPFPWLVAKQNYTHQEVKRFQIEALNGGVNKPFSGDQSSFLLIKAALMSPEWKMNVWKCEWFWTRKDKLTPPKQSISLLLNSKYNRIIPKKTKGLVKVDITVYSNIVAIYNNKMSS